MGRSICLLREKLPVLVQESPKQLKLSLKISPSLGNRLFTIRGNFGHGAAWKFGKDRGLIKIDGSIPSDNPFGSAVYSYGHRNPQGLAWDDQGRLWATEHGSSNFDELNLIEKGVNYGWPVIEGDQERSGMRSPIIHSGSNDTWAPAGAAFLAALGKLFWVRTINFTLRLQTRMDEVIPMPAMTS